MNKEEKAWVALDMCRMANNAVFGLEYVIRGKKPASEFRVDDLLKQGIKVCALVQVVDPIYQLNIDELTDEIRDTVVPFKEISEEIQPYSLIVFPDQPLFGYTAVSICLQRIIEGEEYPIQKLQDCQHYFNQLSELFLNYAQPIVSSVTDKKPWMALART